MDKTTEKQTLFRAKKGELSAFEDLVTAYERQVFVLALRFCGNEQDAQDITQDVFLRAYRSLKSFRGESRFSTWLYRITTNLCLDHTRAGKHAHTVPLEDEGGLRPIADPAPLHQPETAAENTELRDCLQVALSQLSEEHRQILLLRDVSGLTYAEIAQFLKLEEGTVKSRLARARKQLRDILTEKGNLAIRKTSKQAEGRAES